MKTYTITVNGKAYEVTVEEGKSQPGTAGGQMKGVSAEPVKVEAPEAGGPVVSGALAITASVPGKVFKVEVGPGQAVKAGDSVVILEAMKMEIPVVAPNDGVIADVTVAVGDTVESGDILASMN